MVICPATQTLSDRLAMVIGKQWGRTVYAARRYGVSQSAISTYLSGKREPPVSFLIRVAEIEGVTLDWLCRGLDPMYRDPEAIQLAEVIVKLPGGIRTGIIDTVRTVALALEPTGPQESQAAAP